MKKTEKIEIRVTRREKQALKNLSRKTGMTISEFVRLCYARYLTMTGSWPKDD